MDKGKLERIIWKDACLNTDNLADLLNNNPSKYLLDSVTYGEVIAIDDYAIAVKVCEDANGEIDFYIIPRSLIIYPKKYRSK